MTDPAKDAERLAEDLIRKAARLYEVTRKDNAAGPVVMVAGSGYDTSWEVYLSLTPIIDILARLTQERDAACKAHVECAESLDAATQERDEARRSAEALEDRLVGERVAGFRLAEHELTYHARKDSTGDETKEAFHCAANWLSKRAETLGAAQPTPDDVERAREPAPYDEKAAAILRPIATRLSAADWEYLHDHIAAARREGAELRALDEAVIEWAREAVTAMAARAGYSLAHNELRKALAARDAAIGAREGEEESDAV